MGCLLVMVHFTLLQEPWKNTSFGIATSWTKKLTKQNFTILSFFKVAPLWFFSKNVSLRIWQKWKKNLNFFFFVQDLVRTTKCILRSFFLKNLNTNLNPYYISLWRILKLPSPFWNLQNHSHQNKPYIAMKN